ncbi:hypothetical protein KR222_000385, partial [Zaprionus bogoriensis]
ASRNYTCPAVSNLVGFPVVRISNGKLKYILAKVYIHGEMQHAKTVIRAVGRVKYHREYSDRLILTITETRMKCLASIVHIYDELQREANKLELCTQCLGGGILVHDPDNSYIKIYGRSHTLGKADHRETRDILCDEYPTYKIDAEHGGMDI